MSQINIIVSLLELMKLLDFSSDICPIFDSLILVTIDIDANIFLAP